MTTVINNDTPELIPVRMLNEFTYCPRLAYLEWVQSEFEDNLETREGTFAHRRVDEPSNKPVAEASAGTSEQVREDVADELSESPTTADSQQHARSLMLSAPGEGLIAKLDLLELDGNVATPVDYKRGRLPNTPEGAWEPERVQLCAQGLILREAGYDCTEGVLFFVESHRRVTIKFDAKLIARTRELVQGLRDQSQRQAMPPPLEDSPKCPKCSLVGICLPDETNFLKRNTPAAPRRLQPTRTEALPLYLQAQGVTLGKSQQRLTVKSRHNKIQEVRLADVSQVCLLGNIQVTAQALRELSSRGIPICHFSYGGWFHAITQGLIHKNVELRIAQFRAHESAEQSLAIARQMIVSKIKNSRTLLRRHLADEEKPVLKDLARHAQKAAEAESAATLLGVEGNAARLYFGGFATLFKQHTQFDFDKRNRRPPTDPVNALLSFVYALLVKDLTIILQATGFDPMLGLFHRPRYGRPSLALDLAEEFRPLIGDSVVLTLVNNGEVQPRNIVSRAGAVSLNENGRRSVIAAYERRMQTEVTHPIFGYRITYRRILEVQSRLLSRVLLGELDQYPGFETR